MRLLNGQKCPCARAHSFVRIIALPPNVVVVVVVFFFFSFSLSSLLLLLLPWTFPLLPLFFSLHVALFFFCFLLCFVLVVCHLFFFFFKLGIIFFVFTSNQTKMREIKIIYILLSFSILPFFHISNQSDPKATILKVGVAFHKRI